MRLTYEYRRMLPQHDCWLSAVGAALSNTWRQNTFGCSRKKRTRTSVSRRSVAQSIPPTLWRDIDPRLVAPEGTAISLTAACLPSVIAARARCAREMYSVSIVSFGAELGRPPMCLMFNKSHNIIKRFPSQRIQSRLLDGRWVGNCWSFSAEKYPWIKIFQ